MILKLFTSLILLVLLVSVNGQGESCNTPTNTKGVCLALQNCPELNDIYKSSPRSRDVINHLVQSQRNCGTRNVNRSPIVCCQETATTTTTTTSVPYIEPEARNVGNCKDPLGVVGTCMDLRVCTPVLEEFKLKQRDQAYVKYIQASNVNCNRVNQNICCPIPEEPRSESTNTEPSTPSIRTPSNPNERAKLLTPETGCGYSKVQHTRVVGGEPAKIGGWPWMALIGYTDSVGDVTFKCGGTLITKRHVLTAAHCVRSDLTSVRLGEHDLDTDTETKHIDVDVTKVERHPKYDKRDGNSDLAILTLGKDVDFTLLISPICLPIRDPLRTKDFEGYTPFIAGWGKTQEGGKSANVLQELQIPVLSTAKCVDRYKVARRYISEKQFDDAVLCAGYLSGGKDSCQGDSGGPLMAPDINPVDYKISFYQIGIVSYGIGCARADIPGVYAKVQTFIDWIQEKVNEPY